MASASAAQVVQSTTDAPSSSAVAFSFSVSSVPQFSQRSGRRSTRCSSSSTWPVYDPALGCSSASRLPGLVGRQLVVPAAEHLEGAPEALLCTLLVKGGVDVGHVERVDGGGERLDLSLALLNPLRERDPELIDGDQGPGAHDAA